MDQYTPGKLSELYLLALASIDQQFQFWIWISFAVVVAAFVAGGRITKRLRIVIACIYIIAVIVLFGRYMDLSLGTRRLLTLLVDSNALVFPPPSLFVAVARMVLYVVGTIIISWFLLSGSRKLPDKF